MRAPLKPDIVSSQGYILEYNQNTSTTSHFPIRKIQSRGTGYQIEPLWGTGIDFPFSHSQDVLNFGSGIIITQRERLR